MALNKAQILNELGSVMNQLQNADCGCMGKLFSSPGQMTSDIRNPLQNYDQCRLGCHHGNRCASAPYTNSFNATNNYTPTNRCCMGRCNLPKLYADTYSYLNQNLMQPVVQEVYDDLRTITPENTIMNNGLESHMGLKRSGIQSANAEFIVNENKRQTGNQQMSIERHANNQENNLKGMGEHIVDMMIQSRYNKPVSGATLNNPQVLYGAIGDTPVKENLNQCNSNAIPSQAINPTVQYNALLPNNGVNVTGAPNEIKAQQMSTNQRNPVSLQTANVHRHPYGDHTQGVSKFNKMFPGVMQGLEGDLGFDPMAIAIQMNPANQQKSAMNAMHKLMYNNNPNVDKTLNNTVPLATEANKLSNINNINAADLQQNLISNITQDKISLNSNNQSEINKLKHQLIAQTSQNEEENKIINDTAANITQQTKEPLLPVDTTKNQLIDKIERGKINGYNTLGQSVQMLPATTYHTKMPDLPQTLSPQPIPIQSKSNMKYSNVKSTVSKTSIVGNNPDRRSSNSHLQHIYNQYKGSQSFTQSNNHNNGKVISNSEGNLNVNVNNLTSQRLLERVGGDTTENDRLENKQMRNKMGQIGHVGDSANVNKIHGDAVPNKIINNAKARNGLQDMVFTSYPTTTAWSFHGHRYIPTPYDRYRKM